MLATTSSSAAAPSPAVVKSLIDLEQFRLDVKMLIVLDELIVDGMKLLQVTQDALTCSYALRKHRFRALSANIPYTYIVAGRQCL
jgi:hypothetical protein